MALKFFLGSPDPSLGRHGSAQGAPAGAALQKQR
jgi:hypothetical protein